MKNMLKFLGIIAFTAVIGFSLASCGDGDSGSNSEGYPPSSGSGTVSVSNEQVYQEAWDGSKYVYTAINNSGKVYIGYGYSDDPSKLGYLSTVQIGTVTSGKISFTLNTAPPDSELEKIEESEINVNPSDAKGTFASIFFIDDTDKKTYDLNYGFSDDDTWAEVGYWYVDKNTKISGNYTDIMSSCGLDDFTTLTGKADLTLTNGWNVFYFTGSINKSTSTGNESFTSTKPAGMPTVRWYTDGGY